MSNEPKTQTQAVPNMAGEAIQLVGRYGFHVIPLRPGTKIPATANGVKDATGQAAAAARAVEGAASGGRYSDANVGVACGPGSGVVVVDEDADGELLALAGGRPLPPTPTVKTPGGGFHYYFRWDDRCETLKNVRRLAGRKIDVRTQGGYVVAPPSLHPNGGRYEWVTKPDDRPAPPLPGWLFDELPKRGEETATAIKAASDGADAPAKPAATASVPAPPQGDPLNATHTLGEGIDPGDLAGRARAYLAKCPPAVSGEGGHDHTYAACCRLCEEFGDLSDDELLAALADWNAKNVPPWSPRELARKLSEARKRVGEVTQYFPDVPGEGDAPPANSSPPPAATGKRPTMPTEAFHGVLGRLVRRCEPATDADPAAVLVQLLAAVGNLAGREVFGEFAGTHRANLFCCVVGESSTGRKGTAWAVARHCVAGIDPAWESRIGGGASSGEGIIQALDDLAADPPPPGDAAGGSLAFHADADRRLLLHEPEFAAALTAGKRDGSTLSPVLRQGWDGHALAVKTRKGSLHVAAPHLSVVAHITPGELRATLGGSDTTNGYANRFLWAWSERTRVMRNPGAFPAVDDLKDVLAAGLEAARAAGRHTLAADAAASWESEVYDALAAERPGTWGQVCRRSHPQVRRLALCYAAADGSGVIDASHLRAAWAVWRYCEETARRLFGGSDTADRIADALADADGPLSKTDLRRVAGLGNRMPAAAIGDALAELLAAGRIITAKRLKGKKSFDVSPSPPRGVRDAGRMGRMRPHRPQTPRGRMGRMGRMGSYVPYVHESPHPTHPRTRRTAVRRPLTPSARATRTPPRPRGVPPPRVRLTALPRRRRTPRRRRRSNRRRWAICSIGRTLTPRKSSEPTGGGLGYSPNRPRGRRSPSPWRSINRRSPGCCRPRTRRRPPPKARRPRTPTANANSRRPNCVRASPRWRPTWA